MRMGGDGYRSTTAGNLGKAYYQIKKAEAAGYLEHEHLVWRLTERGKAWCGAVDVTNT